MFRAVATALFTYKAEAEDELSFEKDECIYIKSTKGGHWWYGVHKGRSGCVPKKYLKLQVTGSCKVTKSYLPRKPDDLQLLEGNIVEVLVKEKSEWYGRIKDSEGWFPPDHVIEITQSTQEKAKPLPEQSTASRFDEITSKAVILEDVRKQRPKKPSVSKFRSMSIDEEDEAIADAQEPLYDTLKPKEEEIQPKKLEHQEPAWLTELKKHKLGKNKSLDLDNVPANEPPALDKSKIPLFKSTPDLTSDVETNKITNRMSMFLQSPKPFTAVNKNVEVVKSVKPNLPANDNLEVKNTQTVDASKIGQMRKSIELLNESPKRDLEQRVEFLEKLMMTMMEQLTDMRKELMKLKSIELQKIVPF